MAAAVLKLFHLPNFPVTMKRLLMLCSVFVVVCQNGSVQAEMPGVTSTNSNQRVRRIPDEQRLYETIMHKYQQSVMPHEHNASHPLTVAFSLRLNQIVSLDERQQVLTTNVFIDQKWIDPALAWDPDNFTDVRALRIPAQHVWLPDTFVYNNADGGTSGFMRGTYVQIQSNGSVLWPVPLRLRSSCSVQITYFPFDTQVCTLRFGSWIYDMRHLDYKPIKDCLTVDPSTYINNSEWELVSITMNKALSPPGGPAGLRKLGAHPHLTYVLHLKRNTFFYLFNIIVPCAMLSTLNILTFWLPPVSGEKVTLGLSVFLAFSMFMLLIAEEVPATSEAVPLIGVYLCMVMTMTSLSVMMAVVVTNLYHRGRKMRRAPRWLVGVCLTWLARLFCVLNDIPLIASTVDLAEHCQYDVSTTSTKRKSRPRIAQIMGIPNTSPMPTSYQNPSTLPTHLQNGGYMTDVTRQENGRMEIDGELSLNQRNRLSAISAFFTSSMGERKTVCEVHPRARNSVVTSCHFTKIPTSDDLDVKANGRYGREDNKADLDRMMLKPGTDEVDDEGDVWVRRESCQLSKFNENNSDFCDGVEEQRESLINNNAHKGKGKNNTEDEDDDDEDDAEASQTLLSHSPPRHTSSANPCSTTNNNHNTTHTNTIDSNGTRLFSKSTLRRASGKLVSKLLKSHSQDTEHRQNSFHSKKLNPHPTSEDLAAARTMIAEWQQIATVVDRLMFVVYVLTTVIAYVVILVIAPANQPPVTDLVLHAAGNTTVTRHWRG